MRAIMDCFINKTYYCQMNSTEHGVFFSVLYLAAVWGIIYLMNAIRHSKKKAIRHGFYLILASFLCGILLMGWVITQG